jgi:hypothetical protein
METRSRMTADGILQYFGSDSMWHPVDCGDYQRCCGSWCGYFRTNGETAILGCALPETQLELEE